MRHEGRLKQWNDERGFGFIEAAQGGEQIFVHVNAFALGDRTSGNRPRIGERLSFEVAHDDKGRKQARRVVRPEVLGVKRAPVRAARKRDSSVAGGARRLFGVVVAALIVAGLAWKFPQWRATFRPHQAPEAAVVGPGATPTPAPLPDAAFRCDGRTYCSQMTSCAEATFFLRNCPGAKMDGNNDGVPCEQQWCTNPFAR